MLLVGASKSAKRILQCRFFLPSFVCFGLFPLSHNVNMARPYDYFIVMQDEDPIQRMYGWLGLGPGVPIKKQDAVPHVQYTLILLAGSKLSPLPSKEEERYKPLAEEYHQQVMSLWNADRITEESLVALKSLQGAHSSKPAEIDGWPSGFVLYQKLKVLKKTCRNELMPHIPSEIRDLGEIHKKLPSGHGVMEFVNKWLINVYVHHKVTKGKVGESLVRLMVGDNITKIPTGFFDSSKFPMSCILATKVFMHHPFLSVKITRAHQDGARSRRALRAAKNSSGESSVSGSSAHSSKSRPSAEKDRKRKIQLADAITRRKNHYEWKKSNVAQHIRLLHEIGRDYLPPEVLHQRVTARLADLDALEDVDTGDIENVRQGMILDVDALENAASVTEQMEPDDDNDEDNIL